MNPDGYFVTCGAMYGSVALGDVDDNGDMEVVMGGMFWEGVGVYDHDGTFRFGWPVRRGHDASNQEYSRVLPGYPARCGAE